jgi:hypothetical protein
MFAYECVMAMAILTAPEVPGPGACPVAAADASFRPALQQVAIRLEILDPRESRYVLARDEDFAADLKLLRRRYRNLREAPRLSDCQRFPDRNLVNELLTFNRTYREFLTSRQRVDLVHADEVHTALLEVDRLYQIWDAVRDARCTYYYITVRRQALKHLRELIGDAAFYRGELPSNVPVWRFPEVD